MRFSFPGLIPIGFLCRIPYHQIGNVIRGIASMVIKKMAENQRRTAVLSIAAISVSLVVLFIVVSKTGKNNADS